MAVPAGDSYDVVVIGAGLGGLSAAACLAKAGRRVALVEREDGPGGNARAFRRGPYTFDPAIHVTAQGFNIEFLDFYLTALGIAGEVELLRAEDCFGCDIGGERWTLPVGAGGAEELPRRAVPARGGRGDALRGDVRPERPASRRPRRRASA